MREFKAALAIGPADRASAHCDLGESYLLAAAATMRSVKRSRRSRSRRASSGRRTSCSRSSTASQQRTAGVAREDRPRRRSRRALAGAGRCSLWGLLDGQRTGAAEAQNRLHAPTRASPACSGRSLASATRLEVAGLVRLRHLRRVLDDRLPGSRAESLAASGPSPRFRSTSPSSSRSTTLRSARIPGSTSSSPAPDAEGQRSRDSARVPAARRHADVRRFPRAD